MHICTAHTRAVLALVCVAALGGMIPSGQGSAGAALVAAQHLLYLSPTGVDTNLCTQTAPCLTFDRAYDVAQPGQTVEIAGGTYGNQTITGTKAKPDVVFRPAPGAAVTVGDMEIQADNLELRDFSASSWDTTPDSDGFTARNLDVNSIAIFGSANTSVIGGDVGPNNNQAWISYGGPDTARVAPRNVLIDGVYFHDFKQPFEDAHIECLHVAGGDGITIRNSRFQRCDIFSLFFTEWAGPEPPKNIVLENNFFGPSTVMGQCCAPWAVRFAEHMAKIENVTIRNNSSLGAFSISADVPNINVRVVANLMPYGGCNTGTTYSYNVWFSSTSKCSSTDKSVGDPDPGFVDPSAVDLHLKRGSPALGRGDRLNGPLRDIDGQLRPRQAAPDAGADQRETAVIVIGHSIGAAMIGQTSSSMDEFYGAPRRLAKGSDGRMRASYRTHGGGLWLVYDQRTVVGVGTTARYYATALGLGVGSNLVAGKSRGLAWVDCRRAFRQMVGRVAVYYAVASKKNHRIVGISMLKDDRTSC